ncbi:MAG: cation:proton antiporter [Candidatus Saccharimonadales bacterium]
MVEFLTFFIIITAGLLFSEFFNRLHLPWVTALIVSGIVFGSEGFDIIQSNQVTDFFSETGLVFLMFMAGLEISFASFRNVKHEVTVVAAVNGIIPLIVALAIAVAFDMSFDAGFLLGAALISSSIAVVLPSLEGRSVSKRKIGHTIIGSTVVLDIVSVTFFSILIQRATGTDLPLLVLYTFLALALVILRLSVPKIEEYLAKFDSKKFEQELQLIISILLGTVILFGLLGLQPAEAGFFAGLVLSGSVNDRLTKAKLRAIAYGMFIPVFFVMVGAEMQLSGVLTSPGAYLLIIVVLVGSIVSKFGSGFLAGRMTNFSNKESLLLGAATTPQLNVTLAIAATGFAYGLIDHNLLTALIVLSIGTTMIAPILINKLASGLEEEDQN